MSETLEKWRRCLLDYQRDETTQTRDKVSQDEVAKDKRRQLEMKQRDEQFL
jgi:hypothetical protein